VRRRLALVAAAAFLAAAATAGENPPSGPRIRVDPESFDFGKALPGKVLRKEFTVRNFGDAALVIEGVSTTCGCTAALTASNRVEPGGSTSLRVTFETRRFSGRVERQVLVRSNDTKTPLLPVKVSATVEKGAETKPKP
jgi:hypothetical protein